MIVEIFMSLRRGIKSMRLVHQRAPGWPPIVMSGDVIAERQRTPALDVPGMAVEPGTRRPETVGARGEVAVTEAPLSDSETGGIEAGGR
jgi:hypothetical protein